MINPVTVPPGIPPPGIHVRRIQSGSSSSTTLYSSTPTSPGKSDSEPPLDRYAEIYVPVWLRAVNNQAPDQYFPQPTPQIDYGAFKGGLFPPCAIQEEMDRERRNHERILAACVPIPTPNQPGSARIIPQQPDRKGETPTVAKRPTTFYDHLQLLPPLTPLHYATRMLFIQGYERIGLLFQNWMKATKAVDYELNIHLDIQAPPLKAGKTVAENWLFPTPDDVDPPPILPDTSDSSQLYDTTLNQEQRHAVEAICHGQHFIPFLISGPPGTGKTKTLVEAVLQILKRFPFTHVLVCGTSNPSADILATRLAATLKPRDLLRLNAPTRPFSELNRSTILPYCHIENGLFSLPPIAHLSSKRVIVTSCADSTILLSGLFTNKALANVENHSLRTIHPLVPVQIPPPHFGFLLVDEAGQATEPDILCPLAVVMSNHESCLRAHVTLCGDAKQLGPLIVSEEARMGDLDVSLLERLADREVYRDHPMARRNKRANPDAKWNVGVPFVDLTKNYRSATPILMLPSTLLYHDTLEPFAPREIQERYLPFGLKSLPITHSSHNSALHKWSGLPTHGFPIIFHGLDGHDEPVDEGASFYNQAEVDYVCQIVSELLDPSRILVQGPLKVTEISIISPYREQVWRIRQALRALKFGDVDVGNVEALQGAENRIIIISAVRSNERWVEGDRARNRGLINEPKRWNVAMTRAKELLVVVGNVRTLTVDSHWLAFYRFCKRNGCYTGMPVVDGSETGAAEGISRLEERWRAGSGPGGDEAAFDVLVGSMARETLDDDEDGLYTSEA